MRMHEEEENDHNELTVNDFNKALEYVYKNNKDKYKYVLNGGDSLKNAVFNLFKEVWSQEVIPEGWKKSKLVQLWRVRGNKSSLANMRYIHIKEEIQHSFIKFYQ